MWIPFRLRLCCALAPLVLLSVVATVRAQKPVLTPASSHNFFLVEGNPPTLTNDTGMYVSVRIEELEGETPTPVRPHIESAFDSAILSPQLPILGNSTKLPLTELRGVNARITVLTPGFGFNRPESTEDQQVRTWLQARTYADQLFLPFVGVLAGGRWDDWEADLSRRDKTTRRKVKDAMVSALLNQNYNVFLDIGSLIERGDGAAVATLVWNTLMREVLSGGPLVNALGPEIGKRISEHLATSAASKFVPVVDIVTTAIEFADIGAAVITITNTVRDLAITPAQVFFHVYYHAGLGEVTPSLIRPSETEPQRFYLRGFGLELARARGARAALVRNENEILSSVAIDPGNIRPDLIVAEFPAADLAGAEGTALLRLRIGEDEFWSPDLIRIVGQVGAKSVSPNHGRIGALVRVQGEGIDTSFAKVNFGEYPRRIRPARVLQRHEDAYLVEVPAMSAGPCEVWIEEDTRGAQRRSDPIPFTVDEGLESDRLRAKANERMPAGAGRKTGVLKAGGDRWTHEFSVHGGMQVTARLATLRSREAGRPRADIQRFVLELRPSEPDAAFQPVDGEHDTEVKAFALRSHTTDGAQELNTYRLVLESGPGPATEFAIDLEWKRTDDLGRGIDAHGDLTELLAEGTDGRDSLRQLPLIEQYQTSLTGHLFGGRRVLRDDLQDAYRIRNVEVGEAIEVVIESIEGVQPFDTPAALASVRLDELFRSRATGADRLIRVGREYDLATGSGPYSISHKVDRYSDFLLIFDHGRGNVRYKFRVNVSRTPPARKPVVSDFNQRTREDWTLVEAAGARATDPDLRPSEGGVGMNSWLHAPRRSSTNTIDLEVMFAVDTTRSMRPHIDSVREAARTIVQQLADRCRTLRVGLVSYRDYEAGDRPFRRIGLNDQPQATLERLGTWGLGSGGRDKPEDVLQGLRYAIETDWSPVERRGVLRVILLLGDAPAKLVDGHDFAGNTLESIGQSARERGIAILPITVGESDEWIEQAKQLARATGGQHARLTAADTLPEQIVSLSSRAIDQDRIRYWKAPRKFLGAQGAAFGKTLAFRLGASGDDDALEAPDVLLEAAGAQIAWRGFLRPTPRRSADTGTEVRIALEPEAGWYDTKTSRPIGVRRMRAMLNSLEALRIRADHVVDGESWLDDVILGSNAKATHYAPSDQIRGYLERLEQVMRIKLRVVDLAGDENRLAGYAYGKISDTLPEPTRRQHARAIGAHVAGGLANAGMGQTRQRIEATFRARVSAWTGKDAPDAETIQQVLAQGGAEVRLSGELVQSIRELCNLQASIFLLREKAQAAATAADRHDHEASAQALLETYRNSLDDCLARVREL